MVWFSSVSCIFTKVLAVAISKIHIKISCVNREIIILKSMLIFFMCALEVKSRRFLKIAHD